MSERELERLRDRAVPGSFTIAGAQYVTALEARLAAVEAERTELLEQARGDYRTINGLRAELDEAQRALRLKDIELEYAGGRLHVLSPAVGIARLKLDKGDAEGAKQALDHAVTQTPDLDEYMEKYRAALPVPARTDET